MIGMSEKDMVSRYESVHQPQPNLLVINEYSDLAARRAFDLEITKESTTFRKNEHQGWILKNGFIHRSGHERYGILFQMMMDGAIRYEPEKDAYISQICEQTIDCITKKDGTIMDVYFAWDGMIGTNSRNGYANFNISLTLSCENDIRSLSKMDGISYLGAKTCKGSNKITNVFVKKAGTPVQLIIRYEMELMSASDAYAVSEVHFHQPTANFFKIVTR